MIRPHIVTSDEPIREGSSVTAHCGKPITNATFAFVWDGDIIGHYDFSLGGCCRKCVPILCDTRYIYGVIEGQEAKLEGNDAD